MSRSDKFVLSVALQKVLLHEVDKKALSMKCESHPSETRDLSLSRRETNLVITKHSGLDKSLQVSIILSFGEYFILYGKISVTFWQAFPIVCGVSLVTFYATTQE